MTEEETNVTIDVLGAEGSGLVAPSITWPVLTASRPCQTMATTEPRRHVLDKTREEGLVLQVLVVCTTKKKDKKRC